MNTLIGINWIDLNSCFQSFIIKQMLIRFNKTYNNDIHNRFSKKDCIIDLYYENNNIEGICISWTTHTFIYLDKFFSLHLNKGVGTRMLDLFINKYNNKFYMYENKNILLRSGPSTCNFYLKHSSINKYFNYISNNKEVVYLGVGKYTWEYEDIYNINIQSCFQD